MAEPACDRAAQLASAARGDRVGGSTIGSPSPKASELSASRTRSIRTILLPLVALALVGAAVVAWLMPRANEEAPSDCALTPAAHHRGTFQHWRLSMAPGEGGSGEISAAIRLDDGREIIAFNVTEAGGLSEGDKVSIAEISCVHRRIFLLQTHAPQ